MTIIARFPIHVVCEWLGNSQAIAQEHYLQVTDADFTAALTPSKKAARKAARQAHESTCGDVNPVPGNEKTACFQAVSPLQVAGAGFEYLPDAMRETASSLPSGANRGARSAGTAVLADGGSAEEDPTGLASIIAAWPSLPDKARRRILTIVDAAQSGESPGEEELNHFLNLARHGRHGASSGGSQRARKLALAAVEHAPGLDGQAIDGLCEFIRLAVAMPESARDLVK